MEKIIPNGTKVLIFKYISKRGVSQDDENYIEGVIQSSKMSDDLSVHGSLHYLQIYEVLGNDGNRYIGTYGKGLIGNSFFRTKEDHIEILKRKILQNKETIIKLQEKNDKLNEEINSLVEKQKFSVLAVPSRRFFVVTSKKAEELKKENNIIEDNEFVSNLAQQFRVNNLSEEGPILNKKIKP